MTGAPERDTLDGWLALACREPAYGPRFYDALLRAQVFAIRPALGHRVEDDIVRFVMWTGADGERIIPFFSTRELIDRVLTPQTERYAIAGRQFLEATRGATVVLNPNELLHCRLAPQEVAALLDTGAVSAPELVQLPRDTVVQLTRVLHPPEATLQSLTLLYAHHPTVMRAYLVMMRQDDQAAPENYLVAIELGSGDGESVARETSAVMLDVSPGLSTDVLLLRSSDATLQDIASLTHPFYERALGARVTAPSTATM